MTRKTENETERYLDIVARRSCEHSSKLQRFTPSRCLDVRQDWCPMYYPEEMKARVSPMQSIEPHRILAPRTNSNQEPPGPQSRVVTTIILPLFYGISRISAWIPVEISCQIKSFDIDLKYAVYGTMTEIVLIVCSMWSSMIRMY